MTWPIHRVAGGRHTLRIVANAFTIARDHHGHADYRPLSYRVTDLRVDRA